MSLFRYNALQADNTIKKGVIEEIDQKSAAKRLMAQGLRPLEIRRLAADKKRAFTLPKFRREKLTKTDIDFFTTQISLLLNTGLSLDASLRIMKQNSQKKAFKTFAWEMEHKLKEGKSFSEALSDYPMFSSMYVNIARAGEEGGILPAMLSKISEYQKTFQELTQFVVSASIYPLVLMAVGLTAVLILITTILPRFEVLFQGMNHQLPMHVTAMMDVAKFVSHNMILTITALVLPPALIIYYLKTEKGKIFYQETTIRLPVISGFVKNLETTRIFRTLEVLVNNGVHLATSLKICAGVATNIEFQKLLKNATKALKEGQRIAPKLQDQGLFPDLAVDLLAIGEESGTVGEVCGQIADHYENELRVQIKRLVAMIEPAFILMIAVVAGYIVISMLSVILSINEIAG